MIKVIALLAALLVSISCTYGCQIRTNSANAISNTIKVDHNSPEPPLTSPAINTAVPDFLTDEQKDLYRRAYSIFPAFFGNADMIESFERNDEIEYGPITEKEAILIESDDGFIYYASPAKGRYEKWSDFDSMGLSIFTEAYWEKLSSQYRNINGVTYYPDTSIDRNSQYMPSLAPDTFELISQHDNIVIFNVICHYFDMNDIEDCSEQAYCIKKFPIHIVNTVDGWRFSLFNIGSIN